MGKEDCTPSYPLTSAGLGEAMGEHGTSLYHYPATCLIRQPHYSFSVLCAELGTN
jgi:hypothetical protein